MVEIEPNTQLGSNEGGIIKDSNGDKHYIKIYNNPDQAKVEVATAKIYKHLGIKTVEPKLVEFPHSGKAAVISKWDDSISRKYPSEINDMAENNRDFSRKMLKLHSAAALTNNWDVIGQGHDNILFDHHNEPVSIDQGGAMNFRAQGEHKDFLPDGEAAKTLLAAHRPSGQVFGRAMKNSSIEDRTAAKKNLLRLTDEHIDNIISSVGLPKSHADVLKARRDILTK